MSFTDKWINILNEVSEFQKGKQFTWFRGQNKSDYQLNSGLYRKQLKRPRDYIATELYYYTMFQRMGYIHHKESDWNLLFLMQHHGVKTRLLDWTESFAVALYFAYEGWEYDKETSVVWLLDPINLNKLTLDEPIFYIPSERYEDFIRNKPEFHDNSLSLYPLRNSSRIVSQQGMFTIQGKAAIPLEQEFDAKLQAMGILKKIELSSDIKDDICLFLKQSGISDFSLFPDLDGLSKHINKFGYVYARKKQL